ncbi:DNRLRE domain-containing protein [Brevibacillus antibioticus]|uniref:DNRLRE domain-containing protein n=1 Tax=Brevibacillus antibioticus TaxID=2570228 RepID=A0A4U2YD08_9BACL|nr:Ig-like domain-containing protein [Brevibacillus antibioticus]TKI58698.1 DNRLRE domain-containing protein [Brevibacillus antibioticus]
MKRMMARLLVFILLFAIVQPVFIYEKVNAAITDVIRVEANKIVDASGGYPEGLPYEMIPNALIVGYARDSSMDYGAANTALRFDLSGVKSEMKIESAKLRIYVHKVESTGGDMPFIDLWGSSDDSWNDDATMTLPMHHERIITNEMLPSNFTGWKSFDVTSFVKSQIPDKKATFVLRGRQTAPPVPLLYQPQIVFYDKRNSSYASQLEITYAANTPPTDILLSSNSIPENNQIGAVVGTLSAVDPDQGETVTFSILNNTLPFTVEGNQLKATEKFDFETKSTYSVPITATDLAGNFFTKVMTIQVTDVNEPPTTATVTINGGSAITSSANVTLTMSHDDPDAAKPEYRLTNVEGGPWSEWNSLGTPVTWTLTTGEGTKTVFMELRDGTGTVLQAEDSIVLDTTPPAGTIEINNGNEATSSEKVELTIQGSDANGPVEVMLSNDNNFTGSWIPVPVNNKLEWNLASGDGQKTVYARFRDGAGNLFTTSDTIVLDKTPPVVTGVANGSFYTADVTPVFDDGTATLNGAPFASGTKVSVEGKYTLVVTDTAGNTTTVNFSLDKTAPTGTLAINNGATHANNQDVTLQIDATDATSKVKMKLSNDNISWSSPEDVATTKAWKLTNGDGQKTVYVQLIDEAGNTHDLQATITLDTVAPVVTGVENNKLYNQSVTISFNEGKATLNGKPIADGEIVNDDGAYTLIVTDEAGNTTTLAFSIDQTKPSGSLKINGDANYTNTLATTLQIAVTDFSNELQMRFSHDASDPANWTSWEALTPTKAWSLSTGDGTKSVSMEVRDKAGNIASFTDEITLDMTSPTGAFEINQGQSYTNMSKVTLSVESADAHGVEMRLSNDNLTWSDWKTAPTKGDVPWELSGIDGTKMVYLELRDPAGNQLALQKQITLDSAGPVVTGVVQDGVYASDVTITFNEGTALLNGNPFTSGSVVTVEGSYELVVIDDAQNRTTIRFMLDKTPPTGTLSIDNRAEFAKTVDVTLQLTASGKTDDIEMVISNADDNSGTWERFAESKAWKLADGSTNGTKTVYVKLRDKAGNVTKLSDTIVLDVLAPTGSITINNGDNHTKSRDITLTITANDSTSDVQIRFANGDNDWSDWEAATATKAWQLKSGDGTKTVEMQITDRAGHITTVSDTIELDADAPVVTGVEDKGIYKDDVTITFTEGTATLNSAPFTSGDQVTSEGKHELRVVDTSGNETKITFTLDKTAPTGTFVINNDDRLTNSTSVRLHVTATDNLGDVEMRISNEQGKWSSWEKVTGTVPWSLTYGDGMKKVLIQLRDQAGNTVDLDDSIELYVPNVPNPSTGEPVTGVELEEEELTLRVGDTESLRATVKPTNATNKRVKWESSDSEIVEVDEEGKIKAVAPGTATITVTTVDGNKTDSVEVTVKEIATFQLETDEPSFWMKPRVTTTLRLYKVEGKKRKDITRDKNVEYDTKTGLVTVKQGRITAGKAEGEDIVTVRYMGEELEIPVTVSKKTIRSLTTSFKDLVLEIDDEKQLTLTAVFSDKNTEEVTEKATWSSSDEEVVEVTKEGKVTALAEGKAVITAKYGGKKVTNRVLVVEEKKVKDLRVSRSSLRLNADNTGEIVLYAVYENRYEEIVTKDAEWTVEDPEIATVENGVVTALESGKTTITVEYGGETITIKITVW